MPNAISPAVLGDICVGLGYEAMRMLSGRLAGLVMSKSCSVDATQPTRMMMSKSCSVDSTQPTRIYKE
jgi:hypothetical protein